MVIVSGHHRYLLFVFSQSFMLAQTLIFLFYTWMLVLLPFHIIIYIIIYYYIIHVMCAPHWSNGGYYLYVVRSEIRGHFILHTILFYTAISMQLPRVDPTLLI